MTSGLTVNYPHTKKMCGSDAAFEDRLEYAIHMHTVEMVEDIRNSKWQVHPDHF